MQRRQTAQTAQQPMNKSLEEVSFSTKAAPATSHHNVRQNSANAQIGDISNVASNHHHHHHRQHEQQQQQRQLQQQRQQSVETSACVSGIITSHQNHQHRINQAQPRSSNQRHQLQRLQQPKYSISTTQHLKEDNYSNLKPASSVGFTASETSRRAKVESNHLKHSSSLTTGPTFWRAGPLNNNNNSSKLRFCRQAEPFSDQDETVQMTRTPQNAGFMASALNSYAQNSANTDTNPISSIGAAVAANAATENCLDYNYNMIHPTQQPVTGASAGGVISSGGNNNSSSSSNNNNNNHNNNSGSNSSETTNNGAAGQSQLSKVHAHSTSLLANDSYMAGMSSDSELTGNTSLSRQHGRSRPYSSQSRVYHAHPAPRNSNPSSRMSHYSDSAASYAINEPVADNLIGHSSINFQQQQQQQTTRPTHPVGFITSSGNTSSTQYLAGYPDVTTLHQQSSGLSTRPTSGQQQQQQQLAQNPARLFKQSMSIDHHSSGQYHHQTASRHLTSPAHSGLGATHYEPAPHSLESLHNVYQSQQHSYPASAVSSTAPYDSDGRRISNMPGGSQMVSPYSHEQIFLGQQQRNFRHEMEMMEKQTSNINLYDNEPSRPSATISHSAGLPPTASRNLSRQLPLTNPSSIGLVGSASMSVDHLHQRADKFNPPQVHSSDLQQQQHLRQQHQQKFPNHPQQQENLYAPRQMASPSNDWLPPMTVPSHHLNRAATQFKHATSIDHFPIPGQQQHYSPVRVAHLNDHYRSSLAYANSPQIGCYESPTRATQSAGSDHHNEMSYHQYLQEQEQQPPPQISSYPTMSSSHQHQAHHNQNIHQSIDSSQHQPQSSVQNSDFSQIIPRGIPPSSNLKKRSELQHQFSSSSSNSGQSAGNIDINRSLIDQQKANTIARLQHQESPKHKSSVNNEHHRQQQRQTPPRKGYTSVVSGSGVSAGSAYSESGNQITAATSSETHLTLQAGKRSGLRAASPSSNLEAATSSTGQHHHSSSSKEGGGGGSRSESSTGVPTGAEAASSSLTKKSNSATQLSMTGTKKRLGFRKKQLTSFSVHRSEEVAPLEARHLVKQGSSVSEGDSSMSGDSSSRSWSNSNFKPQTSDELASMSFIDGLGKGQMISRQGLASPYLGDIQLSLCDRRGYLEVEIIRARNLQAKANKDTSPLTYVKLYLVKNRKCLAKAKTNLSHKRTLDPLFQQQLTFHEDYHGCILQSIIWGNFGKMDKKNFMGIAQISLDDLELSDTVISWYKLFLPSSLQTLPSKCLRHTLLSNSTESFTNTNNS